LPMKKGRAGTITHDYKRHSVTTLFAALNVQVGSVDKITRPPVPVATVPTWQRVAKWQWHGMAIRSP
jgi:hypothetical protein